uniref:Uncharacterized protein n=1 Tax=Anguilla anguilla TaxID=7936 RepID=A0A0E9UCB2_ANGAN
MRDKQEFHCVNAENHSVFTITCSAVKKG